MSDHVLRVYDSVLYMLSSVDNPTPIVRLLHVTPYKHTQVQQPVVKVSASPLGRILARLLCPRSLEYAEYSALRASLHPGRIRSERLGPNFTTGCQAKLEWYNPFGAVKDRVAANLVRDAEERGEKLENLVEPRDC